MFACRLECISRRIIIHIALFIFVICSLLVLLAWVHNSRDGCGIVSCGTSSHIGFGAKTRRRHLVNIVLEAIAETTFGLPLRQFQGIHGNPSRILTLLGSRFLKDSTRDFTSTSFEECFSVSSTFIEVFPRGFELDSCLPRWFYGSMLSFCVATRLGHCLLCCHVIGPLRRH